MVWEMLWHATRLDKEARLLVRKNYDGSIKEGELEMLVRVDNGVWWTCAEISLDMSQLEKLARAMLGEKQQ